MLFRSGKMLLIDTVKGKIIDDEDLKEYYASREPYGEWLDSNLVCLKDLKIPNVRVPEYTDEERARLQKAFGYTYEEYRTSTFFKRECSFQNNGSGDLVLHLRDGLAIHIGSGHPFT